MKIDKIVLYATSLTIIYYLLKKNSVKHSIGGYYAHFINPKTKSETTRYINKTSIEKAYKEALKIKQPYQEFVKLEEYKTINKRKNYPTTDVSKTKFIQRLQDKFGGKKYNIIDNDTILRIADHSKNPVNDGRYNYDKKVISFVLPAYEGKFSGYNSNEFDLSNKSFNEAVKFIKSKIESR